MPAQRLQHRYTRRLARQSASLDHLTGAIHGLLRAGNSGDPFFLSHCLELLATHLRAAEVTLVMVAGSTVDTRWWYPEGAGDQGPAPVPSFCEWLIAHPDRTLVVKDMKTGPQVKHRVGPRAFPHQAALGCALKQGDSVRSLLFAYFDRPREFLSAEYALLEAVAAFIGRVLEIEDLKQSLTRLEDALAITQAVMEDSSTRDPVTDLPNLRYLEIWERAMLGSEHRPDSLVVAECQLQRKNKKDADRIREAAEGVRAGDLVVHDGPGRIMMIFQHTPRSLAHILLLRLRTKLGSGPMGATLWVPGPDGLGLDSCRPRLEAALAESRSMAQPALVWHLPDGFVEGPLPGKRSEAPRVPPSPRRWEPPTLQKV